MTMAFRVASCFSAIDGAPLSRVAAGAGEQKIPTAAPLSKSSRRLGSILSCAALELRARVRLHGRCFVSYYCLVRWAETGVSSRGVRSRCRYF